jgi:hypothetical protein
LSRNQLVNSERKPARRADPNQQFSGIPRIALSCMATLLLLLTMPQSALALNAPGNSTQASTGPNLTNVNLTTGAVATFVIVLLGLAAAILLMGRLLVPKNNPGRP